MQQTAASKASHLPSEIRHLQDAIILFIHMYVESWDDPTTHPPVAYRLSSSMLLLDRRGKPHSNAARAGAHGAFGEWGWALA